MMQVKKKKRVILAMSSGVDSSVAAALLKKNGYDVVGIFLHFWKESVSLADGLCGSELVENKCCSVEAQEDARKVAQILDIPLYTVNAAKEFKKEVVDYFLAEYGAGRTPNPCVRCNPAIKFRFLFRKMIEMKADFVASGHYAQIVKHGKRYKLMQAEDKKKDQTYFLYNLKQEQLAKIVFPIGKYKKSEVRRMAKEFNLPIFDKDESQGICFTPEKYPTEFLRRNLNMKKGVIIDTKGNVIGKHEGLPLYTIGQRRGINIGGNGPYYVVDKKLNENILVVTNQEKNPLMFKKSALVGNINWIQDMPKFPLKARAKIRYLKPEISATIKPCGERDVRGNNLYEVEFSSPQKAVTAGQSAVFYSKYGEVFGGGVIKE